MSAVPESPRATQLGPYRLIAQIGSGGMGVVYRGVHVETRAQVAIKTVRVTRPSLLATLRREIRALKRLEHPGIVHVLDEGVADGVPWYAMELLQGRTLDEFRDTAAVSSSEDVTTSTQPVLGAPGDASTHPASASGSDEAAGRSPRRPANPWLAEGLAAIGRLCSTLSYLHGNGIVHRDLKPGNILIRPDGTPVLTDFGLVSQVWDASGRHVLDSDESRQGTPAYMAPEQIQGQLGDARIDLYALGAILYELVSGQPPFTGSSQSVLRLHLSAAPRPLSDFVEDVPAVLEAVVARLLVKDPQVRMGYADDVATALEALGIQRPALPDELQPRAYLYRARIVGRSATTSRVKERLMQCVDRQDGALLLIAAESGAGKTSVAAEIGRMADAFDFEVVMGGGQPSASPLQPFRAFLQAVADRAISEGPTAAQQLLGAHGHVLGAFEPAIHHAAQADGRVRREELPRDAARDLVLATLADVVRRFAERRPVLLVLDDLQWADDLSLKFLRSLVDDGSLRDLPVVVIGTFRIDEASADLQALARHDGVETIALAPLDESAIATLIGEMLAMRDVPAALVSFLARASGGNPLFVGEYLRAAVAERLLYRDAGAWRLAESAAMTTTDFERLPLPASLQELVGRRIAGTGVSGRALLAAAAVVGKEFDLELLLAITGVPAAEGLDALADLISAHLFEQTGDTRLAFVHDKIRETEYARLSDAERIDLHARAGASIEARSAGADLPLYYGALAQHWRIAGRLDKALEYLERAGEHALNSSAYADAIAYLNDAVALETAAPVPDNRQAHWHFLLGEAHRCVDEYARSSTHLKRAVALHGWPAPTSRIGQVGGVLLEAARQVAHRWRTGAPPAASAPGIEETAYAYVSLQSTSRVTGDPILPIYAILRSLNLAENSASPALRGMGYGVLQVLLAALQMPGLAARYSVHLARALEETPDPAARTTALLYGSIYHLLSAQWDRCVTMATEARAIASDAGLRRMWEEATTCLGGAYLMRCRIDEGLVIYHELSHSARRGADRVQIWAQVGLAVLYLRRGDVGEAQKAVARLLAIPQDKLDIVDMVQLHGAATLVAVHTDQPANARAHAELAMDAVGRTPSYMTEHLGGLIWLMESFVELWRRGLAEGDPQAAEMETRARAVCKQVLAKARRLPIAEPEGAYWLGQCEAIAGNPDAARKLWLRAAASARALDAPYQRALAERALADSSTSS